jgi:Ca2+-binding RTX toxin-like protein
MFTAKSFGMGLSRLQDDLAKSFDFGTAANTSASASLLKVDLSKTFGLVVSFTGEGLTYDANKVPTGGQITGIVITHDGKVTYEASITDLAANALGAAEIAKSALQVLGAHGHVVAAAAGAETLYGYALDDRLIGGAAGDKLFGGAGNDQLYGRQGNDLLTGGLGNDTLWGGAGTDILSGGMGADTFMFRNVSQIGLGDTRDLIRDFRHAVDTLDLSGIDANWTVAGNQAFGFIGRGAFSGAAGQLRLEGGVLSGDTNGDKVADFEIKVLGTPMLDDLML